MLPRADTLASYCTTNIRLGNIKLPAINGMITGLFTRNITIVGSINTLLVALYCSHFSTIAVYIISTRDIHAVDIRFLSFLTSLLHSVEMWPQICATFPEFGNRRMYKYLKKIFYAPKIEFIDDKMSDLSDFDEAGMNRCGIMNSKSITLSFNSVLLALHFYYNALIQPWPTMWP